MLRDLSVCGPARIEGGWGGNQSNGPAASSDASEQEMHALHLQTVCSCGGSDKGARGVVGGVCSLATDLTALLVAFLVVSRCFCWRLSCLVAAGFKCISNPRTPDLPLAQSVRTPHAVFLREASCD